MTLTLLFVDVQGGLSGGFMLLLFRVAFQVYAVDVQGGLSGLCCCCVTKLLAVSCYLSWRKWPITMTASTLSFRPRLL